MTALRTRSTLPRRLALALLATAAAGCATIPPGAGNNPDDPWEVYNRNVAEFNRGIDFLLIKPLAVTYETLVPQPLRTCVGNFLDNVANVPVALNKLLQGNVDDFGAAMSRLLVNTTVGLGGCFDPASDFDIPKPYTDFGITFGKWGAPPGPYFVLPLLGPSTVRDAVGRVPGQYLNPQVQLRQAGSAPVYFTLDVLDTRTRLFPLERQIDDSGLDRYAAVRVLYLDRRRRLVGGEGGARLPVYEDPGDDAPPASVAPK